MKRMHVRLGRGYLQCDRLLFGAVRRSPVVKTDYAKWMLTIARELRFRRAAVSPASIAGIQVEDQTEPRRVRAAPQCRRRHHRRGATTCCYRSRKSRGSTIRREFRKETFLRPARAPTTATASRTARVCSREGVLCSAGSTGRRLLLGVADGPAVQCAVPVHRNSARSIMAKAILNREGREFRAFSANQPKSAHPYTLSLLRKLNFDVGALRSKSWNEFSSPVRRRSFRLHGLRQRGRRSIPFLPGRPMTAHWGVRSRCGERQ